MELYREILQGILEKEKLEVTFPDLKLDIRELMEMQCYKALQKIKDVLANDNLGDETCFDKIEEIICVFEQLGSNGGNRHDFG